jgi:hypothetical protein
MRKGRRKGSLVVTAFIFVIAMTMIAFGIRTMLSAQLNQSGEIKGVAMAKLQALNLAEMGVNYRMYTANQNLNGAFPTAATIGTQDFKSHVAMVRNAAGGAATCSAAATPAALVTGSHYPPYMVTGTLTVLEGGVPQTYTRIVYFDAAKLSGGQYVLNGYRAQ